MEHFPEKKIELLLKFKNFYQENSPHDKTFIFPFLSQNEFLCLGLRSLRLASRVTESSLVRFDRKVWRASKPKIF